MQTKSKKKRYVNTTSYFKNYTLQKICENTGFHWPVFSLIKTESTSVSLYGRIWVSFLAYFMQWYCISIRLCKKYTHPKYHINWPKLPNYLFSCKYFLKRFSFKKASGTLREQLVINNSPSGIQFSRTLVSDRLFHTVTRVSCFFFLKFPQCKIELWFCKCKLHKVLSKRSVRFYSTLYTWVYASTHVNRMKWIYKMEEECGLKEHI